jgi:hypothetical protein
VIAHAAPVYDGDRVVAWAEYGTAEELPNNQYRKEYVATAEQLPDYRVHLHPDRARPSRSESAAIALRGAVELIAKPGGDLVEGYSPDTAGFGRRTRCSSTRHPHDVRARRLHLRPARARTTA